LVVTAWNIGSASWGMYMEKIENNSIFTDNNFFSVEVIHIVTVGSPSQVYVASYLLGLSHSPVCLAQGTQKIQINRKQDAVDGRELMKDQLE
jgi:hypothetical protein